MEGPATLYEPRKLADVVGNRDSIAAMRLFAESVNSGHKRKPIMIYGPSGTGKSAAVYALASEYGWEVVELSASEYRDSDTIERVLFPAAMSNNVFGNRNLILLDEIDELASRFDTGAAASLAKLMNAARNPVIFVANDYWDRRISFLRNAVDKIEFKKVDMVSIASLLERAAAANGIDVDRDTLTAIARRANGDVRSALNDLFAFVGGGDREEIMHSIGQRDVKRDVFETLDRIFYSNTLVAPLGAAASCDVDKDMLMRWIEENIARRYRKLEDMREAFASLSDATIYSSRANVSQQYGLWRYMNAMLSSGVALAKTDYPDSRERYSFPRLVSDLSRAKERKASELEIAEKLQGKVHANLREIRATVLPLISSMMAAAKKGGDEGAAEFLEATYGLDRNDVKMLAGPQAL